jgi:hypothetical protein
LAPIRSQLHIIRGKLKMAATGPATVQQDQIETGEYVLHGLPRSLNFSRYDQLAPPESIVKFHGTNSKRYGKCEGVFLVAGSEAAVGLKDESPDSDIPQSFEESLFSMETLDRSSPELWPAQSEYLA